MGLRAGAFVLFGILSLAVASTKKVPDAPYYYVLDEPGLLQPAALRSLQSLLIEHDRLTGEQVLIAVFNELEGEDLNDFTNRVFSSWRVGKRGKDNGVLLTLFWKERKARIEAGYGLEGFLTEAKARQALDDSLYPELKEDPKRALQLTALEILKLIESPLIESGKAEEILRAGGLSGVSRAGGIRGAGTSGVAMALLVCGTLLLILLLILRLAEREAHYTGGGWFRPNPLRKPRRAAVSFEGGGAFGSW